MTLVVPLSLKTSNIYFISTSPSLYATFNTLLQPSGVILSVLNKELKVCTTFGYSTRPVPNSYIICFLFLDTYVVRS